MEFLARLLVSHNPEKMTAAIKYIYLDIVDFTRNRSVEAQSDIIAALNSLFRRAIRDAGASYSQSIFIPTGDGICLALLEHQDTEYDIHVQIALQLLKHIQRHNKATPDTMRQFSVRIGINENLDNLITDINGKLNVAGLGVNLAQRIMGNADGNQVLVGQAVYERLRAREKYMQCFRPFHAVVKHGDSINLYQLIDAAAEGLNNDPPTAFAPKPITQEDVKLTKLAAYYFAFAIRHKDWLYSIRSQPTADQTAVVLLYFTAYDALQQSETSPYDSPPLRRAYGESAVPFSEQLAYYAEQDFWCISTLAACIADAYLRTFSDCFEETGYDRQNWAFVNKTGIERLQRDWPDLFQQFHLEL